MKNQIANILSMIILSLGFFSIFLSIQGFFLYAAYLIIVAAIIDGINALILKTLETNVEFGKALSSISGLISFVVSPAFFSYVILFQGFQFPFNYVLLALPLALVLSGTLRAARLNSGKITGWHGMKMSFNVVMPILFIFNFFSIYIVSGWIILSSVLMLSNFRIRKPSLKKKKKAKEVEIKEEPEEEKEETPIVPLPFFGGD